MKKSLRQLEWSDIVMYFLDLRSKEMGPKDIVDYFHFKYLTGVGIERWTTPDYIRQTGCAKKMISLYGDKLTVEYIDILFRNYREILGKDFADVRWSVGILSSEKTGWILEKVFKIWAKEISQDIDLEIKKLLTKGRSNWSREDAIKFTELMNKKGENNG